MRMSDAEAIMWAVEKDPALRSDFTNISILERAPDAARVRAKVEQAIVAIPRLGDRVVASPFRLATPEWVPDHDLDLDYHLRTIAVPALGAASSPPRASWPARSRRVAASTTLSASQGRCAGS